MESRMERHSRKEPARPVGSGRNNVEGGKKVSGNFYDDMAGSGTFTMTYIGT
jgi:hypothetical protein